MPHRLFNHGVNTYTITKMSSKFKENIIRILCTSLSFFRVFILTLCLPLHSERLILLALKRAPQGEFNLPAAFLHLSLLFSSNNLAFSLFVPCAFPTSLCLYALYFLHFIRHWIIGLHNRFNFTFLYSSVMPDFYYERGFAIFTVTLTICRHNTHK